MNCKIRYARVSPVSSKSPLKGGFRGIFNIKISKYQLKILGNSHGNLPVPLKEDFDLP
jgi:hypothetical protein